MPNGITFKVHSKFTRMVGEAHERMNGIDGLVYNVGIGVGSLWLSGATAEDWDRVFAGKQGKDYLLAFVALWDGGIVFYGSVIGGIIGILIFCRRRQINPIALTQSQWHPDAKAMTTNLIEVA